jgi:hypothetical protein
MSNVKDINQARILFEQHLLLKGIPFERSGQRYSRVNVQTKWRYFCLGYFASKG